MKDYIPPSARPEPPPNRAGQTSVRLINLLKGGITFLGIVVIFAPLYWVPSYLSNPLSTVEVGGNRVLSAEEVVARLGLSSPENWLELDPFDLAQQALAEPWIKSIDVKKKGPTGLWVQVTERSPIAYLKTRQGLYLIDSDLVVLDVPDHWGGWDLPVFTDPSLSVAVAQTLQSPVLYRALELLRLLKNDPVLPLDGVSEINLADPMNLVLTTSASGLRVKMGFDHFEEKLHRLHLASADLVKRKGRLAYIDLRNPQGVVIKRLE